MFLWCHGHEPLRAAGGPQGFRRSVSSADAFPMTSATALGPAYIIAARRTALGRPGGLHRSRRIESLTAPVVQAALRGCPARGRARSTRSSSATPRRAAIPPASSASPPGSSDSVPALTVDRQCASGLDAILLGMRAVALGEARVVVAGGAESLSTAPWRVARPKSLFQTPRFIGLEPEDGETADTPHSVTASEELARRLGITRRPTGRLCAALASARPSRPRASVASCARSCRCAWPPTETRDRGTDVRGIEDLAELAPIMPPDGTHTSGNISALQEGAAVVVIVSAEVSCRARSRLARLRLAASVHAGRGRRRGGARPGRGAGEAAAHEQRLHARAARRWSRCRRPPPRRRWRCAMPSISTRTSSAPTAARWCAVIRWGRRAPSAWCGCSRAWCGRRRMAGGALRRRHARRHRRARCRRPVRGGLSPVMRLPQS